jgi:hypothetical protein
MVSQFLFEVWGEESSNSDGLRTESYSFAAQLGLRLMDGPAFWPTLGGPVFHRRMRSGPALGDKTRGMPGRSDARPAFVLLELGSESRLYHMPTDQALKVSVLGAFPHRARRVKPPRKGGASPVPARQKGFFFLS